MSYEPLRRRPTGPLSKRGYRWSAASGRWRKYKEGGDMEAVLTVRRNAVCRRVRAEMYGEPRYAFEVFDDLPPINATRRLGSGGSPAAAWKAARTNLLAEALTA